MVVVGRLLVLLAMLLMPLGMAPTAAPAPPISHHMMMAGMAKEHCPDQSNRHEHNGLAICSMACASALPAQEIARDETPLRSHQLVHPMAMQALHGILLEIATPPPKLA